MTNPSAWDTFPPRIGDELPGRRRLMTQEVISAYARASGDHNPIHLDLEYARKAGLPTTIAHGLLTLGTACTWFESAASEQAWVSRVSCRFSAPVPAGEEIVCSARVSAAGDDSAALDLAVLTAAGERALTKARIELRAL